MSSKLIGPALIAALGVALTACPCPQCKLPTVRQGVQPAAPLDLKRIKGGEVFQLGASWKLCSRQPPRIRVIDARTVEIPRDPAELEDEVRLVYLRATEADDDKAEKDCRMFAALAGRGDGETRGRSESAGGRSETASDKAVRGAKPPGEISVTVRAESVAIGASKMYLVDAPLQGKVLELPEGIKVCPGGGAALSKTVTLSGTLEASRRLLTLPLRATRTTTATTCDRPFDIELEVLVLPKADEDTFALDWSPDAPNVLRIEVASAELAASRELRRRVVVEAEGVGQAEWDEDACRGRRCAAVLTAKASWKSARNLRLRFAPADHFAFEDVLDPRGAPFDPATLVFRPVSRWLLRSLRKTTLSIKENQLAPLDQTSLIDLALEEPLTRFLVPGPHACRYKPKTGAAEVTRAQCVIVEPSRDPRPATQLHAELTPELKKDLRELASGRILTVERQLATAIELVEPESLTVVALPAVEIKLQPCRYELEQLSLVFAGLSGGSVYYLARPVPGSECNAIAGWTAHSPGINFSRVAVVAHTSLVRLDFEAIPRSSAPAGFELSFRDPHGVGIDVAGDKVLLQVAAEPRFTNPRLTVKLDEVAPLVMSTPAEDGRVARHTTIGIDRASWIRVSVPNEARWRLFLESDHVAPCGPALETVDAQTGFGRRLPFRDGAFCLVGVAKSAAAVTLRAELRSSAVDFALRGKERLLEEALRGEVLSLGSTEVSIPFPTDHFRIAYPLDSQTLLACGSELIAGRSRTRAVRHHAVESCHLYLRLSSDPRSVTWSSPAEENCGVATCTVAPCRTAFEETFHRFGPQHIKVELIRNTGAGTSTTVVAQPRPFILSETDLRDGAERKLVVFSHQNERWIALDIPIDLTQAGAMELEDYKVVKLRVSHMTPADYVEDGLEGSRRAFETSVRRMPKELYITVARKLGREVGVRTYLSAVVSGSFYRTPSSGLDARTSSDVGKPETVPLGAGGLYVVELWNYDRNKPVLPLNPQLQAGVIFSPFINTVTVPRPIFVFGLGLRLPGGTSTTDAIETSVDTEIWGAAFEDAFDRWQVSLMLGLGVKLGSLGS